MLNDEWGNGRVRMKMQNDKFIKPRPLVAERAEWENND